MTRPTTLSARTMTNSANAGLMMGTAKPVFTNTLIAREISIGCITAALTSLDRQQYEGDAMLKTSHSPPLYHVNGYYWERPKPIVRSSRVPLVNGRVPVEGLVDKYPFDFPCD